MRSALLRRIDAIARGAPAVAPAAAPEAAPPAAAPSEAITFGRLVARPAAAARAPPAPVPPPAFLPGAEVTAPAGGAAWLVESAEPAPPGTERIDEGLLFLDIETTGLGSFPLFLAGVLSREGGLLRVRQYLARTYAEEGAVVSLFAAEAGRARGLASYNGRSYDLPFLKARAATVGVPFHVEKPHRDLLPECRRAVRARLPDCRLATVEARILGRPRADDLPGAEVPAVYHAWVRTGDARGLARILRHNRDDLLSLASLAGHLGYDPIFPEVRRGNSIPARERCVVGRPP